MEGRPLAGHRSHGEDQIGRASGRGRGEISVGAGLFKKKKKETGEPQAARKLKEVLSQATVKHERYRTLALIALRDARDLHQSRPVMGNHRAGERRRRTR